MVKNGEKLSYEVIMTMR